MDIERKLRKYLSTNKVTVDSFWEDHVLKSIYYGIYDEDELIGYFAVTDENILTLFYLDETYSQYSQEFFEKAKKYEQVTEALIPTSDEFFLSHALDNYIEIKKQAYFFKYSERLYESASYIINIRELDIKKEIDLEIIKKSEGFLDDELENLKKGSTHLKMYAAFDNNEVVGFGITENGRITKENVSIGMYVCKSFRKKGYGSSILKSLGTMIVKQDKKPISGCWYYNHNSKKTIERAGGFTKTRLLRIYF